MLLILSSKGHEVVLTQVEAKEDLVKQLFGADAVVADEGMIKVRAAQLKAQGYTIYEDVEVNGKGGLVALGYPVEPDQINETKNLAAMLPIAGG